MKSIARAYCLAGLLLCGALRLAASGSADDQIPWAADFRTACGMAAEQRRLVLLHFYNDNCEWCVRLEQNVFSKPEVAEAVALNYLAVKVHAGKQPQLASRYHVKAFPTDVIVTPSGLEVYRTVSQQKPADYIAVLNQVAQQTGVSAARQWKSHLPHAVQPAMGGAAVAANNFAADVQGASRDAGRQVQSAVNQAQQHWGESVGQFQRSSDGAHAAAHQATQQTMQQATAAAEQVQQQSAGIAQQSAATANRWSQQATDAAQHYQQQAGDSYRQFRDQAGQTGQQFQQVAESAKQEWRAAGQQTGQQLADVAKDMKDQWQATTGGSLLDRRSAFAPVEPSPASDPAATSAAVASPTPPAPNQPASAAPQPSLAAAPQFAGAGQAWLPTENPFVTRRQPAPSVTADPPAATSAAQLASSPPAAAPPFVPAQPQSLAANAPASNQTWVPVSQAPAVGLDGFCPVTLMETVARDPKDKSAWKKGDPMFGAIHAGRTYLFTSEENQKKFLANPDAYAPVLAGCDPVRYAERGELLEGKRAYGLITDKQIFLFADEASRNRFEQSPGSYSAAIQQAMLRREGGGIYR
jgi:thioredoxin-related protein/YHS domain-containing protein